MHQMFAEFTIKLETSRQKYFMRKRFQSSSEFSLCEVIWLLTQNAKILMLEILQMLVWSRWIKNQPRGFPQTTSIPFDVFLSYFRLGVESDDGSKICHATMVFIRLQHSKCQKGGLRLKCSFKTVSQMCEKLHTRWENIKWLFSSLQSLSVSSAQESISWRSSWRLNAFSFIQRCNAEMWWKPAIALKAFEVAWKVFILKLWIACQHHFHIVIFRYFQQLLKLLNKIFNHLSQRWLKISFTSPSHVYFPIVYSFDFSKDQNNSSARPFKSYCTP